MVFEWERWGAGKQNTQYLNFNYVEMSMWARSDCGEQKKDVVESTTMTMEESIQ